MAKKRLKPTDRWAFWEYDQFPYMLGGVINEERTAKRAAEKKPTDRPSSHITSYDRAFYHFAILDGYVGAALHADLEAMRAELREDQKKLADVYKARLKARLEQVGVLHPQRTIWWDKGGVRAEGGN